MGGLEELLLCGASLYAVGFYNKKAFFDALPEQVYITYNEVGKWFFSERISGTIAYISFTHHGMDLVRRLDHKDPKVVVPFLTKLVEVAKGEPTTGLDELTCILRHTFSLFGDTEDGQLAALLGEVQSMYFLPSKLLLDGENTTNKRYHRFLCEADTNAALRVLERATTLENTNQQLQLFCYVENAFTRILSEYRILYPEDIPPIENMLAYCRHAIAKTKKIRILEEKLAALDALNKEGT